jgi:hypothetical protein
VIYREIVHTCANVNVARAAVDSIGGDFARNVEAEASRHEMTRGAFAARLVKSFADGADEGEWRRLAAATRGSDLPILRGLRYIVERARDPDRPPAWMIAASRGVA